MFQKPKSKRPHAKILARPIPSDTFQSSSTSKGNISQNRCFSELDEHLDVQDAQELQPVKEESNATLNRDIKEQEETEKEKYKNEVERFVEVSKYFSNPLRKSASYISEHRLVSYPNPFRIAFKRGGVTTQHIKFSNLTLEPVFIKLYKLIPDFEQIKYINLSLSRCKRIPPGLSFNLGFVYDDVNEKPSCNGKMIFVASRKTITPCYQICEINLMVEGLKNRPVKF